MKFKSKRDTIFTYTRPRKIKTGDVKILITIKHWRQEQQVDIIWQMTEGNNVTSSNNIENVHILQASNFTPKYT